MPSSVTDILTRYAEIAMGLWTPELISDAGKLKRYIDRKFILQWELGISPTREQMRDGGLTDEDLISVGLLVETGKEEYRPHFQGRIIIPHIENDQVVYVTGRRIYDTGPDGKPLSKQYKALSMFSPPNGVARPDGFNLDVLKNKELLRAKDLFVVEGPLDAAYCCSIGQPAVAFGGGALDRNKGLIERLRDAQKSHARIYVALDGTPDVDDEKRAFGAGSIGPSAYSCTLPQGLDPDDLTMEQVVQLKSSALLASHAWIQGIEEARKSSISAKHWALDNIQSFLKLWRKLSNDKERRLIDMEMCLCLGMNRDEYYGFVSEGNGKHPPPKSPPASKPNNSKPEPGSFDGSNDLIDTGEGDILETQVEIPNEDFDRKRNMPLIQNFTLHEETDEKGKTKWVKHAVSFKDVVAQMTRSLQGWPRSASGFLFYHNPSDRVKPVKMFESTEELFGYFHSEASVMWADGLDRIGRSMVTKKEYFTTVGDHVHRYDGVELCPHEPMLENYYYAYEPDAEYLPDGGCFRKLLSFFDNIDTTNDRELVKAMFMTPMAALPYDTRPAFAITAGTRNCGKSTLAEAVGELYGGYIDLRIKNRDTERDVYGRLLAPHNIVKRVARIDNVKGLCSSEELEAILTSPVINGHRFMKGDASRPNNLTFILTGNALNLSTDISRRTFTIRLTSPAESDKWREELMTHIRTNRKRIFADIIAEMRKPKEKINLKIGSGGWASWCALVLSHVKNPNEILLTTKERRSDADEEVDEAATILESIDEAVEEWNLGSNGRYPKYDIKPRITSDKRDTVFISSRDMALILHRCFPSVNFSATMAARWMRKHLEAKRMERIAQVHTAKERGFYVYFDPPIPVPHVESKLPYD